MKRARRHLENEVSLYYIGSKHSLGPSLRERMLQQWKDLDQWTLVDAFAGSGGFCAQTGDIFQKVIANDIETYSRCVLTALFVPPAVLPDFSRVVPRVGYITREYCQERQFFTEENGALIDGARDFIKKIPAGTERDYAIGCVLMAADRVANTTSVYGAYLKKIKPSAQKVLTPKHPARSGISGKTEVWQMDATEACRRAEPKSVLAIDPPYTARPYGCNYTPLNVIADIENEPELVKKGGFPADTPWNRSAWNNKKKALLELRAILTETPAMRAVMNYNTDGLLSEKEIVNEFEAAGWKCAVERYEYIRFRAKGTHADNPKELFELFFLAWKE